jgi:hypothetical protein
VDIINEFAAPGEQACILGPEHARTDGFSTHPPLSLAPTRLHLRASQFRCTEKMKNLR